jgi:hypothetical protein
MKCVTILHAGTNGTDINICGRRVPLRRLDRKSLHPSIQIFSPAQCVCSGCKTAFDGPTTRHDMHKMDTLKRIHLLQSNSEWRRCRYFRKRTIRRPWRHIQWRPPVMDAREKSILSIKRLGVAHPGHFSLIGRPINQSRPSGTLQDSGPSDPSSNATHKFDVSSSSMQIRPPRVSAQIGTRMTCARI